MSRSRLWLVGVTCALLSFGIPLLAMNATADHDPQLRLLATGDSLSALIVTDDARVLVINSMDRGVTRSAIGRVARPWEPDITTLIAPAEDRAAVGLWEALQLPSVRQVLVLGVPGSDPIWTAIERESHERQIELNFVGEEAIIDLHPLTVALFPASDPYLTIRRAELVVAMSLGEASPPNAATVTILNSSTDIPVDTELFVFPAANASDEQVDAIYVQAQDLVTLSLNDDRIRVEGGRFAQSDKAVN